MNYDKTLNILNRKMVMVYGYSLEEFISLPDEIQNALIDKHLKNSRINNKNVGNGFKNNNCSTLSNLEAREILYTKLDEIINREHSKKDKIMKKIRRI